MVRKVVSLVLGILLIIVGIIGIFVPILPQFTPIIAGLALIGYVSPRVKRKVEPVVKRCDEWVRQFTERLSRRIRRR